MKTYMWTVREMRQIPDSKDSYYNNVEQYVKLKDAEEQIKILTDHFEKDLDFFRGKLQRLNQGGSDA